MATSGPRADIRTDERKSEKKVGGRGKKIALRRIGEKRRGPPKKIFIP